MPGMESKAYADEQEQEQTGSGRGCTPQEKATTIPPAGFNSELQDAVDRELHETLRDSGLPTNRPRQQEGRVVKTMKRLSSDPIEDFMVPLPDRARLDAQQWDWREAVKVTDWEYVVKYLGEYLDNLYEAIGEHLRG